MFRKSLLPTAIVLMLLAGIQTVAASELSIGARTGFSAVERDGYFHLHEIYGSAALPWSWESATGWALATGVSAHAGLLRASQDNGFLGSVGPQFKLSRNNGRLSLVAGLRIAYMDDHNYNGNEQGGRLNFIEDIGLSYRLPWHFDIGYRFQHISNANLHSQNPGIDLHMFEISYRF